MSLTMICAHADLQKYIAAGCHPSASLEMQMKPPAIYGISKMPQPASAAMLLHQDLRSEQSGASPSRPAVSGVP